MTSNGMAGADCMLSTQHGRSPSATDEAKGQNESFTCVVAFVWKLHDKVSIKNSHGLCTIQTACPKKKTRGPRHCFPLGGSLSHCGESGNDPIGLYSAPQSSVPTSTQRLRSASAEKGNRR